MIWHIFKKDARLLWPLAVLAAIIHGVSATVASFSAGREDLYIASIPLAILSLLVLVTLVVAVAHQDLVPGVHQDWLIRPINRLELIGAKLLFIVLLALSPLFVADMTVGLAHGFPLGEALSASLRRSAALLCFICVPTLIVAAITRTLTEFGVTVIVAAISLTASFAALVTLGVAPTINHTGLSWITTDAWAGLAAVTALTALPLQ